MTSIVANFEQLDSNRLTRAFLWLATVLQHSTHNSNDYRIIGFESTSLELLKKAQKLTLYQSTSTTGNVLR